MGNQHKAALKALALAAAQYLQAVASTFDETPAAAAPAPKKEKPAKAAETKPAETPVAAVPAVAAVVPAAPKAEAKANGAAPAGDIMAQCRGAAKAYAEVYGREGLKEVLKKYTEGTLADVAAEKLPELLKDLS